MFGVGGWKILGSLVGPNRGVVVGVLWKNAAEGVVFVGTWRVGKCVLTGGREETVWIARLDVLTHYFLLELLESILGCETKEMSGKEVWLGVWFVAVCINSGWKW